MDVRVQLSHPYMTTGKTIVWADFIGVGKEEGRGREGEKSGVNLTQFLALLLE